MLAFRWNVEERLLRQVASSASIQEVNNENVNGRTARAGLRKTNIHSVVDACGTSEKWGTE